MFIIMQHARYFLFINLSNDNSPLNEDLLGDQLLDQLSQRFNQRCI